jgi:cathepsin L
MAGLLRHLVSPKDSTHQQFDDYLSTHKKSYAPAEQNARFQKWRENAKLIETHNRANEHTYSLKLNQFADWSHEEFKNLILPKSVTPGPRPTFAATRVHPEPTPEEIAALPASVDWRTKNAVTMVKDQGVCGSCWTFGTTGSVEGVYAVKYGKLIAISEQQIVDCAWTSDIGQGDSGCDGGFAAPAMQWIMDNKGIALESDYHYLMVDGWCDPTVRSSGINLKGYVNVTMNSEAALQQAVATVGPVAVAIDAAHEHFEFYSTGVYYNPKCHSDMNSLDHEVLVVGYGTENGQDYWIVKNSWSTHWGDKGFIQMARNRNNNCGIATQATYPIV